MKILKLLNRNKNRMTVAGMAKLFDVKLERGFKGKNTVIKHVLTQSVYAESADVVIAARWYGKKRTIDEALERGAAAVFCDKDSAALYTDPRVIAVDDPTACVERFEQYCERDCTAKRITITGSVGKTTTTGLINSVFTDSFHTLTHHSMSNSHGAILRNFQRLTPEHEYWVQEVGGVQPGYIESSAHILHSDCVVLTNIGNSHLDKYGTKEGIFEDKSSLERYAELDGVVIINSDDEILKSARYYHKVITFAVDDVNADYRAENISLTRTGTSFDLVCSEGRFPISLNLFGKYNAYNALAAVAAGRWANIPMERIIEQIGKYQPSGMRQNMLNVGGYHLLADCFNAEPKTVLGSAETLAQMEIGQKGRKIFITGHIDKIGEQSVQMHTELGHQLSKLDLDVMVFFAGDSKYTYQAVVEDGYKNAFWMNTREELDNWIRENVTRDDVTFYKSGQFEAALAKTIDHVYGTRLQNEQQFNNGTVKTENAFSFRLRQDDIVEICGYEGTDSELDIPSAYEEKPVLRIASDAFKHNKNLKTVSFPDSVENIGQEAFYHCTGIKEIKLPAKLKYICRSAFNQCRNLTCINLPDGTLHIEMRAFHECASLECITIPSTVGFIGEEAFYGCPKIKIVCEKGSYAEMYARDNNIPYENER